MNKKMKERLFREVGKRLTLEMHRRKMGITQLSALSGEQIKTLNAIKAGKPFYAYHFIWLEKILGIDVSEIIKNLGETNEKENGSSKESKATGALKLF